MTEKKKQATPSKPRNMSILKTIDSTLDEQAISIKGLFILALFYTLYFARELILPILFSLVFYFLLYPSVSYLKNKLRIPRFIGALIVLLTLLGIIGFGFYYLSIQAKEWIKSVPDLITSLNKKLDSFEFFFRNPLKIFSYLSDFLENTLHLSTNFSVEQSWTGIVFTSTWQFLIACAISLTLLYFLLASENIFLSKVIKVFSGVRQKKADTIVQQMEDEIWKYLFTRTMMNVGVAVTISLLLYLFGVPYPILWGVMAGVLEFIPFIGAMISLIVITIVSIVSFENVWHILSVPFLFFLIISIEGNFLVPYIMGQSLILSQVSIVLGVFIFGWIWGVWGAFLAIPLMMIIKIISQHLSKEDSTTELLEE